MATKTYQFTRDVVVDGKRATAGQVWDEADFPVGALQPCLRVGHVVPLPEPPAEPAPKSKTEKKPEPPAEPAPKDKGGKKPEDK